jgi:hypothetical protein
VRGVHGVPPRISRAHHSKRQSRCVGLSPVVVNRCVGISIQTPRSLRRSNGFSGDWPRSRSPMSRAQTQEL